MLNDETGEYEVQPKTKDFSKTFFAPYHPKANRMFKMLKNKYDIDTVFKKTKTSGNILKHSRRALTDNSTNSTQFTRSLPNALKYSLGNPNEKWVRD